MVHSRGLTGMIPGRCVGVVRVPGAGPFAGRVGVPGTWTESESVAITQPPRPDLCDLTV